MILWFKEFSWLTHITANVYFSDINTKYIGFLLLLLLFLTFYGFPGGSDSKESACNAAGSIPGSGSSLEKEMAIHSSILAWKTQWTEKPRGLQST